MEEKWYDSKLAAKAVSLMLLVFGSALSYLKPTIGVPVLVFVFLVSIFLLFRAYTKGKQIKFSLRKIPLCIIIIAGLVIVAGILAMVLALRPHSPELPTPTFIDSSAITPSQEILLQIGTKDIVYKLSDFDDGGSLNHYALNSAFPFIPHIKEGKLYVNVNVCVPMDGDYTVIEINNNVARDLPANYDRNQDDYAFEVVNEEGDPIFQLYYVTQFHVVINGIFCYPKGPLYANKDSTEVGSPLLLEKFHLDPIFKYPSSKHKGKRIIPLVVRKEGSRT
ncbi:hypothetical protein ACFLRP_02335 [Bacteroidota bacterium]